MRIGVLLDLLPAIRKCNDKFVIVTVGLTTDFVQQPRIASLEEPNHVGLSIGLTAVVLKAPVDLASQGDHRLDP
jgi:hypothetical protein